MENETNPFGFDANPIFQMEGGLVVMPAEAGTFILPNAGGNDYWQLITDLNEDPDAEPQPPSNEIAGDLGYISFDAPTDFFGVENAGQPWTGPLRYTFEVTGDAADVAGDYFISLRGIRPENGEAGDLNNDFFVKVGDDGEWTKLFFGGDRGEFQFGTKYDFEDEGLGQPDAKFTIDGPGEVEIFIAGRSVSAGLDQIHIQKDSFNQNHQAEASSFVIDDTPEPAKGSIFGRLSIDLNGDSRESPGDDGDDNETVQLIDENGVLVATTTTFNDGIYSFQGVEAGRYKVRFDGDDLGRPFAPAEVGSEDNDSDVVITTANGDGDTAYFEIAPGQTINNVDASVSLSAPPPPPPLPDFDPDSDVVVYRMNAGGPEIAAIDGGPNWSADLATDPATGGDFLVSGGDIITGFGPISGGQTVPGSTPDGIFDTERSDNLDENELSYAFDVSSFRDGPFEVRLYVANGFFGTDDPGERIFSVSIEDETPDGFEAIDPVAAFGDETGGMLSTVVYVDDGEINIRFDHGAVENPLINGIEIIDLGLEPVLVTVGAPTPAAIAESGDTGSTTIEFPLSVDVAPTEDVVVSYNVLIDGEIFQQGLTASVTGGDDVAVAEIPNDDLPDGDEEISIQLISITTGSEIAALGATTTATATLVEDDINTDPVAVDDTATIGEDDGATLVSLLGNDSDADGHDLVVDSIDDSATIGLATLTPEGLLSYDPNGQFEGLEDGETATDTVTYTISDPFGGSATATVTLTITGSDEPNVAPVAVDDTGSVGENGAPIAIDLLANDTDGDDDQLTVDEINTAGLIGLATLGPDGVLTYDPNGQFEALEQGETATETLTYTVSDPAGETDTATVTITVVGADEPNNDPGAPIVSVPGALPENSAAGTVAATLAAVDADGDPLTYVLTNALGAPTTHPFLEVVGTQLRVKPNVEIDYEALRDDGSTSLTGFVTASDGEGASDPVAFSIQVADEPETVALGDEGGSFRDTGGNESAIVGGAGADEIFGGGGDDNISGGDGDDTITGGVGDDELSGGAGADELRGNSGVDILRGGDGDDMLFGGGDDDLLFGGAGDDLLVGVTGDDQLFGEAGDDNLFGRANNDGLDGGDGDDRLTGNAGDDVLTGGAGADVLLAGGGDDTMEGGEGRDAFIFQNERGSDIIEDFEVGVDFISFRDRTFGERELQFSDLELTQDGSDAIIRDRGLEITLEGVNVASLDETDFVF